MMSVIIYSLISFKVTVGIGGGVPFYPLSTRYPDQNRELIARVPVTLPVLTLWLTPHYGLEIRNEGVSFGSAFAASPVPSFTLLGLWKAPSGILYGVGPFFALTQLGGYTSPEEQWKNWAFGLEFLAARNGLTLWHSLSLRPWVRLGYINFLATPKRVWDGSYSVYPANELRNLFSIDLGVDIFLLSFPASRF